MRVLLSFSTFTANLGKQSQCKGGACAAAPAASADKLNTAGALAFPSATIIHSPPHSPFGIRLDLPFDLDALPRLNVQLSNNQSLQGQTTGVSPSQGKASSPAWARAQSSSGRPRHELCTRGRVESGQLPVPVATRVSHSPKQHKVTRKCDGLASRYPPKPLCHNWMEERKYNKRFMS